MFIGCYELEKEEYFNIYFKKKYGLLKVFKENGIC